MPKPTNKTMMEKLTPAPTTSDPNAFLTPEQLAFAELLGILLAAKWRREHQP